MFVNSEEMSGQICLLASSEFFGCSKELNGGPASLCVNAAAIGEILILLPGCKLSAQLRKDMVRAFLGSGGAKTFQSLLAGPRIRSHLCKAG